MSRIDYRLSLLVVCRYYADADKKTTKRRPLLFQNLIVQPTSWQSHEEITHKHKRTPITRLRLRTTKLMEQFLIGIYPRLKNVYRNEIVILASDLESNLFTSASSRSDYEDLLRLNQRTKILLWYTARKVMTQGRNLPRKKAWEIQTSFPHRKRYITIVSPSWCLSGNSKMRVHSSDSRGSSRFGSRHDWAFKIRINVSLWGRCEESCVQSWKWNFWAFWMVDNLDFLFNFLFFTPIVAKDIVVSRIIENSTICFLPLWEMLF